MRGIEGQSRSMPFNASGGRSEYPHGGRIQALGRRTHRRTPCSFGICCRLSRFAPRNVPLHPTLPPHTLPRTAPRPGRARLPPSHPAAAAQLCDLCALCGSKKNTAAPIPGRLNSSHCTEFTASSGPGGKPPGSPGPSGPKNIQQVVCDSSLRLTPASLNATPTAQHSDNAGTLSLPAALVPDIPDRHIAATH